MVNLQLLSQQDLLRIHAESLEILGEIGIRVPNKLLLDIFKQNGACVDFDSEIVKIPAQLVDKVIEQAVDRQNQYYAKTSKNSAAVFPLRGWMSESNLSSVFYYT
jgi:trimethylamine:corrinoid methyltransferase-like protein